jgi:hypothetical protein
VIFDVGLGMSELRQNICWNGASSGIFGHGWKRKVAFGREYARVGAKAQKKWGILGQIGAFWESEAVER